MTEIKLGDKVKDEVTGLIGIAVERTKFLNGCIQYGVVPKLKKGEKPSIEGSPSIDQQNLRILKRNEVKSAEYPEKIKKTKATSTGGRMGYSKTMRGY